MIIGLNDKGRMSVRTQIAAIQGKSADEVLDSQVEACSSKAWASGNLELNNGDYSIEFGAKSHYAEPVKWINFENSDWEREDAD